MRFSISLFTAALATLANASSPAGFSPSVNKTITVRYGNTTVTPNQTLPIELVSHRPAVSSLNGTYNGTYILALIDLSIDGNQARKATNLTTLVPGLQANRTTRLHWLQGGVKHSSNGSLIIPNNTAVAPYAGPQPPPGDIAHTYVFYLFSQGNSSNSSITLTGINAGRNYTSGSTTARYDFNVTALVATYGTPLAANYIRVKNVNGTSSTNGTTGGSNHTITMTTSAPTAGATNPSASSTTSSSSRAAAATHFAAAGLFGLVGAVVLL